MKISRAHRPLRTEFFATSIRDETKGVTIAYSDTILDPRIDAHALDYLSACKHFLGLTAHYLVKADASVEIGRNPHTITSEGDPAFRDLNFLVAVVGGRNEVGDRVSTITAAQRNSVEWLLQSLADSLQTALIITDYVADKSLRDRQHELELAEERQEARLDQLEVASGT